MYSMNKNIKNIIFRNINENYSVGKYGDFRVIIMRENGYINATKLCADAMINNNIKKEFKEWLKNDNSKMLIKEISLSTNIPSNKLVKTLRNASDGIKGTYVHPDLIPHIVSWASPQFAMKISEIVNKYLIKKALNEIHLCKPKPQKDDAIIIIDEIDNKINDYYLD